MRMTRKNYVGFWQGIVYVVLGIIGWLFVGWCHIQFNKIPSVIISTILWCGAIGFVCWLIKRCADEDNMTVWSWLRQLVR